MIAPAVAARNQPADPAAEIRLLLVHGILHLLGYDHEDEDERAAMWAAQERYSGVSVLVTGTDWFEIGVIVLLVGCVALLGRVGGRHHPHEPRAGAAPRARRGAAARRRLLKIAEEPAPYLNVVLLLTLLATIGGTTLASTIAVRHFGNAGELIATIVMTLVLFVFADVTPKTLALQRSDRVGLVLGAARRRASSASWARSRPGLVRLANAPHAGQGDEGGAVRHGEGVARVRRRRRRRRTRSRTRRRS